MTVPCPKDVFDIGLTARRVGETTAERPMMSKEDVSATNVKGGENMKSEWEELESWSKEDLIIELVHWRNMYGIVRVEQDDDCPWPYAAPKEHDVGGWPHPGDRTTDEWAERIALFGAMHPKNGEFDCIDLMDYGLDEDQAYEVCERLRHEGRLNVSEGIKVVVDR